MTNKKFSVDVIDVDRYAADEELYYLNSCSDLSVPERFEKIGYYLHHTAVHQGYISRKNTDGVIYPYEGRFGKGYIRLLPNRKSTNYCIKEYWVKDKI